MSKANRPLSPHLQVYKWRVHMMTSILHRATGAALAVGTGILVWWLCAIASGAEAYNSFVACMSSTLGQLVLIGITFALMQHMASGIRHLLMDKGELFDLKSNTASAWMTYVLSILATALIVANAYGFIGGAS